MTKTPRPTPATSYSSTNIPPPPASNMTESPQDMTITSLIRAEIARTLTATIQDGAIHLTLQQHDELLAILRDDLQRGDFKISIPREFRCEVENRVFDLLQLNFSEKRAVDREKAEKVTTGFREELEEIKKICGEKFEQRFVEREWARNRIGGILEGFRKDDQNMKVLEDASMDGAPLRRFSKSIKERDGSPPQHFKASPMGERTERSDKIESFFRQTLRRAFDNDVANIPYPVFNQSSQSLTQTANQVSRNLDTVIKTKVLEDFKAVGVTSLPGSFPRSQTVGESSLQGLSFPAGGYAEKTHPQFFTYFDQVEAKKALAEETARIEIDGLKMKTKALEWELKQLKAAAAAAKKEESSKVTTSEVAAMITRLVGDVVEELETKSKTLGDEVKQLKAAAAKSEEEEESVRSDVANSDVSAPEVSRRLRSDSFFNSPKSDYESSFAPSVKESNTPSSLITKAFAEAEQYQGQKRNFLASKQPEYIPKTHTMTPSSSASRIETEEDSDRAKKNREFLAKAKAKTEELKIARKLYEEKAKQKLANLENVSNDMDWQFERATKIRAEVEEEARRAQHS